MISPSPLIFAAAAAAVFALAPLRIAILAVYLGGLMLLPIAEYGQPFPERFPWWIVGPALPSEGLVAKTWIAALAALAGAAIRDPRALAGFRPGLADLPMAAWCLWPLAAGLWIGGASPGPVVASLLVTGCWGAPWLLGRVWFATPADRALLVQGLALSALVCLPVAVAEGLQGPFLHDLIYGPHPFRFDGDERYLGFRPIGFFLHGNLYGIWAAAAAVAAAWSAAALRGAWRGALAALALGIALASQSVGALLLMAAALALLAAWGRRWVLPLLGIGVGVAALLLALHLSGAAPVQRIARNTALGQAVLDAFRSVGRASFLWRISQDLKAMAVFEGDPLVGVSAWDWWRAAGTRPWGLVMLMAGQYGLIAVALVFGGLGAAAGAALVRLRRARAWRPEAAALPLAAIVLMGLGDAVLNAFFLFPAVLAAGAVAAGARTPVATPAAAPSATPAATPAAGD
ncbi:hypothetical protein [Albimonas pacifica]|uniref:O-Antigen ligase n=1 Tax=Albimonas pacifica TaxID=1114924 RepID=A0A1I3C534_9RHOB|nr:hypothetical protein [Albimonas pacifica]SFH69091.1 hypothetical protein SAMN05216258_101551 [Albimonas pacifica]